ncbi:MAG TPA: C25 family cysteine peptidase, partial [Candidatus Cloacimonadota bacterium]|nr:C25 family cysteine peptidase [Candidatus Cloacimonadota bacterium]
MRKPYLLVISIALVLMLPALLFAQEAIDRTSFRILEHNDSYIDIEFQTPQWKLETESRGNQTVSKVVIPGANYLFIDEEETLPIFSTAIAIPYTGGAELRVEEQQQSTRSGLQMSFQTALAEASSQGRLNATTYPESSVLISEPKIIRDYRIVTINVMPFQYNRTSGSLTVNESMRIRVNLGGRSSVNEMEAPTQFSSSFEKIYRGLILNYDQVAGRTGTFTNPTLLVVYGYSTDSVYLGKVAEYISWKRQKGFNVNSYMAPSSSTSSDAIKTYIQNQYNNASTRPDYIVLIGDVGTTVNIPTFSSYVDYQYTLLAGNDNLGDVVIGRISIESADQLNTYVSKLMAYEKDLDVSAADWLNRMLLVGDTASSGISTIYTNEYVHDVSYYVNPNYTYTEVYNGSPSSTTINAAINQGVSFYNYRGYIGMSGWPSSMSSMYNTNKMFHAVFITCNTGTFGGSTSTTEQVVRYGTAASKSGAITAIGMATSSTHTPMNNCLNVGIFHGIYPLEMRDMGEAMLYGKLYLNLVYGVSNPTQAVNFSQYCNLMGDPTASVYVGVPATFNVTAPSTYLAGSSTMEVLVRDNSNAMVE